MTRCNEMDCGKQAHFLVIGKENGIARYAAYACSRHTGSQVDFALGSIHSALGSELSYEITAVENVPVCGKMAGSGTWCTYEARHRHEHSFEPEPF
jgi:hypothetical protein